jgi:hypothetical protein
MDSSTQGRESIQDPDNERGGNGKLSDKLQWETNRIYPYDNMITFFTNSIPFPFL